MRSSSLQLTCAGVRHVLIGALAVGAWGYPRASKDVDFLVGDEAFDAKPVRLYLEKNSPEMLAKFDAAASEAQA